MQLIEMKVFHKSSSWKNTEIFADEDNEGKGDETWHRLVYFPLRFDMLTTFPKCNFQLEFPVLGQNLVGYGIVDWVGLENPK